MPTARRRARASSPSATQFGIPLLVLVDTPGYMPGTRQETAGVIRFGATLVHAFAEATVPRVTVILRKAFGGAFITMNSKDLGADYVFAWPQAEIGVMGAKPAVGIIHRRELAAADDPEQARDRLAAEYADKHLRPEVAAREGYVDELIAPADTRDRVAGRWPRCGRVSRRPASARRVWGDARERRASAHRRHRLRRDGGARALPRASDQQASSPRSGPPTTRRRAERVHATSARVCSGSALGATSDASRRSPPT